MHVVKISILHPLTSVPCVYISVTGGISSFRHDHEDLCENSLQLQEGHDASAAVALSGALPHLLPSSPDIENAEMTTILPFLYLGNERDAQDLDQMQRMNIGYILNVTTHLPLYLYDLGMFKYKRLPATDSNKQNLRQYFEEAFEFIGMVTASDFINHFIGNTLNTII